MYFDCQKKKPKTNKPQNGKGNTGKKMYSNLPSLLEITDDIAKQTDELILKN